MKDGEKARLEGRKEGSKMDVGKKMEEKTKRKEEQNQRKQATRK